MATEGDSTSSGRRVSESYSWDAGAAAAAQCRPDAAACQIRRGGRARRSARLRTKQPPPAACRPAEIGPRLPAGEHYIDWTGSALYWNSQVEQAAKVRRVAGSASRRMSSPARAQPPVCARSQKRSLLTACPHAPPAPRQELQASVFGNPHSCNPSSARTERAVEELRLRVLRFLGADPAEYDVSEMEDGRRAAPLRAELGAWCGVCPAIADMRVAHRRRCPTCPRAASWCGRGRARALCTSWGRPSVSAPAPASRTWSGVRMLPACRARVRAPNCS